LILEPAPPNYKQKEAGATKEEIDWQKQNEQATLNFKQGFDFLMNDNPDAAVQFLARAVYFDKNNARYHAYFGKALSADKKHRHKAEAEFQTAVKLDAENAAYRIMLAEFFIQVGLFKRAEGELNRLLAIFPSNREARTLLDSLQKK
jgi:predicted Zn-dependent protease